MAVKKKRDIDNHILEVTEEPTADPMLTEDGVELWTVEEILAEFDKL